LVRKREFSTSAPWEVINYWLQMEMYFTIIKCLSDKGLNPKIRLTKVHVYEEDLLEVFGPKCNFKLTIPLLHVGKNRI
jgi:hypothetical protein